MRRVRNLHHAAPALALLALTACNDTTDPGTRVDVEPVTVWTSVESLVLPVYASTSATRSLEDAAPALVDRGVVLDRQPAVSPAAARLGFDLVTPFASVEFPPEVLGQTFIFDPEQEQWVVDPERTAAPADGVRIIWYRRSPDGVLIFPLVEDGFIDLTDQDDGSALSRLGIRIVARAADGTLELADFVRGSQLTEEGGVRTEHIESSGFYQDQLTKVEFGMVSNVVENTSTGARESSLDMTMSAPGGAPSYEVEFTEARASTDAESEGSFLVTVFQNNVTTVLDLAVPGAEDLDASGTISNAGTVVANVVLEDDQFRFTTPAGERIDSGQSDGLSIMVQVMVVGFNEVLNRLPFFVG